MSMESVQNESLSGYTSGSILTTYSTQVLQLHFYVFMTLHDIRQIFKCSQSSEGVLCSHISYGPQEVAVSMVYTSFPSPLSVPISVGVCCFIPTAFILKT